MKIRPKKLILGLSATLILSTTVIAFAGPVMKNIRASMGDIKIFIDGNIKIPTDANGSVVEPIVYNGTTYLPVRALTNMLTDKDVSWDQQTQSVHIGKQPTAPSIPIDKLPRLEMYREYFRTGETASFPIMDKTVNAFNAVYGSGSYGNFQTSYILNAKYSNINGSFVVPQKNQPMNVTRKLEIYSLDKYDKEILIAEYSINNGDKPIEIDLNVSGVEFIRFKATGGTFYNVTLKGVN